LFGAVDSLPIDSSYRATPDRRGSRVSRPTPRRHRARRSDLAERRIRRRRARPRRPTRAVESGRDRPRRGQHRASPSANTRPHRRHGGTSLERSIRLAGVARSARSPRAGLAL